MFVSIKNGVPLEPAAFVNDYHGKQRLPSEKIAISSFLELNLIRSGLDSGLICCEQVLAIVNKTDFDGDE